MTPGSDNGRLSLKFSHTKQNALLVSAEIEYIDKSCTSSTDQNLALFSFQSLYFNCELPYMKNTCKSE